MSSADTTATPAPTGSLAPAPTITNAGTRPTTPRKLFVNIPVTSAARS